MSETKTSEGCQFPTGAEGKCGRPTEPANGDPQGRGRPSAYCDNPDHNAGAAWRARQKLKSDTVGGGGGAAGGEAVERPVSMARETASYLLEQARRLAADQHTTFSRLAEQLDTLADPDAAAAQLESATADYEQRLAEAHASWTRSENDRRDTVVQRDEANAAAEEATASAEQLTGQLAESREEATQQRTRAEAAEAERERLTWRVDELSTQLAERDRQLSEQTASNEALTAEVERLTAELSTTKDTARDQRERADSAEADRDRYQHEARDERTRATEAEREQNRLSGQLERLSEDLTEARQRADATAETLEQVRAQHADDRASLAALRAELDAAHTATQAERDHATQRLADQQSWYEQRIQELREELVEATRHIHEPQEGGEQQ